MKARVADRAQYLLQENKRIASMEEDPAQSPDVLKDQYRQWQQDLKVFAKMFRHARRIEALIYWLNMPTPPAPRPLNRINSEEEDEWIALLNKVKYIMEEDERIAMMKEDPAQSPDVLKDQYRQLQQEREEFAKMYPDAGRMDALMNFWKKPYPCSQPP
jgi:hypothetical protein